MFKKLIANLAGKWLGKAMKLEDGPMGDSKKWWKSKTIIAGIVATLDTIYQAVSINLAPHFGWSLPVIPPLAYTIINTVLGGVVVHGRYTADTEIAK